MAFCPSASERTFPKSNVSCQRENAQIRKLLRSDLNNDERHQGELSGTFIYLFFSLRSICYQDHRHLKCYVIIKSLVHIYSNRPGPDILGKLFLSNFTCFNSRKCLLSYHQMIRIQGLFSVQCFLWMCHLNLRIYFLEFGGARARST